jgi:hypothetical protein
LRICLQIRLRVLKSKAGPGQRPGQLFQKYRLPFWAATGGSRQEIKRAGFKKFYPLWTDWGKITATEFAGLIGATDRPFNNGIYMSMSLAIN